VGDAIFGFAYTFSKSMDAADNEEGKLDHRGVGAHYVPQLRALKL
jgi:hypothetical protein